MVAARNYDPCIVFNFSKKEVEALAQQARPPRIWCDVWSLQITVSLGCTSVHRVQLQQEGSRGAGAAGKLWIDLRWALQARATVHQSLTSARLGLHEGNRKKLVHVPCI